MKNGLTTSLLFFLENAKNLGRSDDAKRRKKEVGLMRFAGGLALVRISGVSVIAWCPQGESRLYFIC